MRICGLGEFARYKSPYYYHGLYGTSCCLSHAPSQWERAIFDPPQLRDPSTDFHVKYITTSRTGARMQNFRGLCLHHPAETESDSVFGQLNLQLCQSPVPNCQPTATEISQSLPLGSGTVFLSTSHLPRHSPPSAFVSRHTIIISAIHSTFVRACEVTS